MTAHKASGPDGEGAVQACFQLWLTTLYELDIATKSLVRKAGGLDEAQAPPPKKQNRRSVDF